MKSWYAIQTKPRRERFVELAFEQAGVETYCPQFKGWARRRGRKISVKGPLFPGYLFARVGFAADYARVRWTPGLVRFVMTGNEPIEVGEETLSRVRELEKQGTKGLLRALGFKPGTRVRVVHGPFAGFEGRVSRTLSAGERVRILLELFHRQSALDCEPECLERMAVAGRRP